MEIRYSKQAVKFIKKLNEPFKTRIKVGILKLPDGDIKKMKNYNGAYRLRVGDYRIVYYLVNDTTILVDRVGLRGQVYKK